VSAHFAVAQSYGAVLHSHFTSTVRKCPFIILLYKELLSLAHCDRMARHRPTIFASVHLFVSVRVRVSVLVCPSHCVFVRVCSSVCVFVLVCSSVYPQFVIANLWYHLSVRVSVFPSYFFTRRCVRLHCCLCTLLPIVARQRALAS
jgi:hypothetical protein